MNESKSTRICAATAIKAPAAFALSAVEAVLKEFMQTPGTAHLALNVQQLHVPLQAMVSVPVRAEAAPGPARNEWHLVIRAESKPRLYPVFEGTLKLLDAANHGSELLLEGSYVVPLGGVGRIIDFTLLRGVAEAALRRFLRDVANRVATLSKWTAYA